MSVEWDITDFLSRSKSHCSPQLNKRQSTSPVAVLQQEDEVIDCDPLEDVFCTQRNLDERLVYLNQELAMLGFPSIFYNNNNHGGGGKARDNLDITQLVNSMYELLKRQHTHVKARDHIEERRMRSENDNEFLIQSQTRLKQDLENMKREAAMSLCREKEQANKNKILQQELKNEREERRKMKSDVDHLKKQFSHELKRTEKETTRLQAKVHQLLTDKTQEKKITFSILNSLQRVDGKRSTWNTAGSKRQEEEMYKILISNYEEKEKVLLLENQSIRELLLDVKNQLSSLDSSLNSEDGDLRQIQMPFHMVKVELETKFKNITDHIKSLLENHISSPPQKLSTSSDTESPSLKHNLEELQSELTHYKSIVSGQEKIIQSMKDGNMQEALEKALTTFDVNLNDLADLQTREKKAHERQKKFHEEQRKFTEYVLKIEKEKEEFEKERVEFYMKCLATPNMKRAINGNTPARRHESTPCLKTVQPCFSPAPPKHTPSNERPKLLTPSTNDLYKFMSLSREGGEKIIERRNSNDGSFLDTSNESSRSRKLQEHVNNVRRAVEEKHNQSLENEVKSN